VSVPSELITTPLNGVHHGSLTPDWPRAAVPGRRVAWAGILLGVVLCFLSLMPRLVGLHTYVTTDELFWIGRAGNFATALSTGNPAGTFQTGHPGVTTMWAGLLGVGLNDIQAYASTRAISTRTSVSRTEVSRAPNFLEDLAAARRVVAVSTALLIGLIGWLTWRVFGFGTALLSGALLAFDPFYLAHSQLLHLDALQSGFMTVGVLAGVVRWQLNGGRGYVVVAAAATGLAVLSKMPALYLAGFLPGLALVVAARRRQLFDRGTWLELLGWGWLVLLTCLLVWPTLWAAPGATLHGLFGFVETTSRLEALGATPPPAVLPGPSFYILTWLLRTTPLAMVGLALCGAAALIRLTAARRGRAPAATRCGPALTLVVYALGFGALMTVAAKSVDRYVLPALLPLDLLAGLGLARAARRLSWVGGAGYLLAGALLLPAMVYPLASSLPYPLAWYNPLAGGGVAAQRTLAVGWGEGLDQVAAYLNRQPNAELLRVAMSDDLYRTVLDAQFVGTVMRVEGGDPSVDDADYVVRYIRAPLDWPPIYDPHFQNWTPEQMVRIGGIDYAQVYPAKLGIPLGADFGGLATLEGYGIESLVVRAGKPLDAHLFWRAAAAPVEAKVKLTLTDRAGRELARSSGRLDQLAPGQAHESFTSLTVPPGLSAGEYLLWAGLESGGETVPLNGAPASLAAGAPEAPERAVLRSVVVR
jgi:4-amino-4-deoxy-L-arabinose transferase-like glycosyltransferase